MSGAVIQADYDELTRITRQFHFQAEELEFLLTDVARCVYRLQTGDWIGNGAEYFYDEMRYFLFPAMRRLIEAMDDAARATWRISAMFQEAEQEAAGQFRGV